MLMLGLQCSSALPLFMQQVFGVNSAQCAFYEILVDFECHRSAERQAGSALLGYHRPGSFKARLTRR